MPVQITQIADFSLKDTLAAKIKSADRSFWSAFFAAFIALNILFLFHGTHYMFGDHDWQYVKTGVPLASGLFEGRFTQFILINLLTRGEILPIINNLIGFGGYSLGLALLARYWHLPHNKRTYILFALFGAITPYILSFMYFAFLILPVLSWSAFAIGGLLIAEKGLSFKNTLAAATLFTLALGGYPPVINLIAVALTTRLLFTLPQLQATSPTSSVPLPRGERTGEGKNQLILNTSPSPGGRGKGDGENITSIQTSPSLEEGARGMGKTNSSLSLLISTLPALFLALIAYKLILIYFTHTGAINSSYYNLQTTPLSEWGNKSLLVLKDMFLQFAATLPFIPASYKTATIILTILALLTLGKKLPTPSASPASSVPPPLYLSQQVGRHPSNRCRWRCHSRDLPAPSASPTSSVPPPLYLSQQVGRHPSRAACFAARVKGSPASSASPTSCVPLPRGERTGEGDTNSSLSTLPLLLFAAIPLAALATLFISTSVAETEFSPRIDFFGLNYAYMAMFALTLRTEQKWIRNLALATATLTIIISANEIFEAQKVWKLGFDAEQSLYRRVLKRHEHSPLFNPHGKYIIVQAGSPSFRQKYYHTPYTHASDDLLNISYTPGMNAGVMWNYLSPTNYADTTSYVYTFQPDAAALEALRTGAPYPSASSTAVGTYWLLTILTPTALRDLQTRYHP